MVFKIVGICVLLVENIVGMRELYVLCIKNLEENFFYDFDIGFFFVICVCVGFLFGVVGD